MTTAIGTGTARGGCSATAAERRSSARHGPAVRRATRPLKSGQARCLRERHPKLFQLGRDLCASHDQVTRADHRILLPTLSPEHTPTPSPPPPRGVLDCRCACVARCADHAARPPPHRRRAPASAAAAAGACARHVVAGARAAAAAAAGRRGGRGRHRRGAAPRRAMPPVRCFGRTSRRRRGTRSRAGTRTGTRAPGSVADAQGGRHATCLRGGFFLAGGAGEGGRGMEACVGGGGGGGLVIAAVAAGGSTRRL